MSDPSIAPFGTWQSSVTVDLVAGASVSFSELAVDGDEAYWIELRPADGGRRALVRYNGEGEPHDVTPAGTDVGTRVHEYGGGAYAVRAGLIVYSERSDGSVSLIAPGGERRAIVTESGCRYAGFAIDLVHEHIYAVREDHRDRPPTAPDNALVMFSFTAGIDPAANAGHIVAGGSDFVLPPQLSPDGAHIAWIAWNHPDMPWDATRLYVADLDASGNVAHTRCVAGEAGGESIVAARWTPAGELVFTSDRTNWWNVYALRGEAAVALAPLSAEFGEPPWVFGRTMLAPIDGERILCAFVRAGIVHPGIIAAGSVRELPYGQVDTAPLPYRGGAIFISTPADAAPAIARVPEIESDQRSVVRASSAFTLDAGDVSIGEPLSIPSGADDITHFFYYPPRSSRFHAPVGTLPPLIVMSHGGPTAMHTNALNLGLQWWTTRGFAVAHVNYRGSSGFGRAYRSRLDGTWGVNDVIDCIAVARWLAENGRCDPERIAIRGGSASGMTALLALATSDVFRAATSLYGVMELEALAGETHKFEARYTDRLVGPLPDARERYRERSPLTHAGTIDAPVLLFQGLEDRVVPPNQATAMRDALLARGIPVVYEAFEGEGHGFRKSETIRRVYERELDFYRDVFGLTA